MKPLNNYFSEETLSHLKPQQGLSERYQRRVLDVTLACKLTHVYGKYHLTMLHRQLAMSEEQTTFQQAERQAVREQLPNPLYSLIHHIRGLHI